MQAAPPRRRTNDEIAADEAAAASVESAATALLLQGRAKFTWESFKISQLAMMKVYLISVFVKPTHYIY